MREGHQIGSVGQGWGPLLADAKIAEARLTDRLRGLDGRRPFERKMRAVGTWGRRHHAAGRMASTALRELADHAVGRVMLLRATDGEVVLRLRRGVELEGGLVLAAALTQLGVDYVWADSNPIGPGGGTGAGFDCSGFTLWCYAQVGVVLPHSAEAQRTHPLVERFDERAKLLGGDLIFYDAGDRLEPGQADHVGIADGHGGVVDASSGLDEVVHRDMNSNPVLVFGRVRSVNGAL